MGPQSRRQSQVVWQNMKLDLDVTGQ